MTCFQILFRSTPTATSNPSEISTALESISSAESWMKFVRGCLAAEISERLLSHEALKLIAATQKCENIAGDPRQDQHLESPEVEVLNQVLVSWRSQESQSAKTSAAASDLSEMVIQFHCF